jgi:hypothetical protein
MYVLVSRAGYGHGREGMDTGMAPSRCTSRGRQYGPGGLRLSRPGRSAAIFSLPWGKTGRSYFDFASSGNSRRTAWVRSEMLNGF